MRNSVVLAFMVFAVVILSSCAGSVVKTTTVTITNKFTTIQAGSAPVTLNATISQDGAKQGLMWTLTISGASCSPDCGMLAPAASPSLSAVYTPPPTTANSQPVVVISAVSVANSSSGDNLTFAILNPTNIVVSITNKFTSQMAGAAAVAVGASVTQDNAKAGVTWMLTSAGTACSPDCGTLTPNPAPSFSAAYMPPATVPASPANSPTITATSVSDTTKSDSFTFSIVASGASNPQLLQGSYALLLHGFSVSGSPVTLAGSVVADGQGNITNAELDIDSGGGITAVPAPQSGTYNVDTSFNASGRGTITITSFEFPGGTTSPSFNFALSADGKSGTIVEFDGTGFKMSGTLDLQDPNALTSTVPTGVYVFGLVSDAPVGARTVEAGQMNIAGAGTVTGIVDQAQAGAASPQFTDQAISSGTATAADSLGRGTLTIGLPGSSTEYAYYVVSAAKINIVQIDAGLTFGTVQSGVANAQQPLTANSVNATSVLQMTGMNSPHGTDNVGPAVTIGVMTISGGSAIALDLNSNNLGSIGIGSQPSATLASFDPTTGRGVITSTNGFDAGFVNSGVIYLWNFGQGFILDTDPSNATPITNDAFLGTFTPQSAGPFDATILSGNLSVLSGGSASVDIPYIASALTVDNTASTFTGIGDVASSDTQAGNVADVSFSGSYAIDDATLGHGTAVLPSAFFGDFTPGATSSATFYVIGPNQLVLIGTQNGVYSGVTFVQP
ncbi:MAG TPA: hypothetical protein VGD60_14635 [Candidatus Acidoferrales bacterium]